MAVRRREDEVETVEQRVARLERMVVMGQGAFRVLVWFGAFVTFGLTVWTLVATALSSIGTGAPPPPSSP